MGDASQIDFTILSYERERGERERVANSQLEETKMEAVT
jgi:hypothetical protein